MSEQPYNQSLPASEPRQSPPSRPRLRRIGCLLALAVWFVLLLIPCFFIMLVSRGEITLAQGSAPNQMLRIWLISEADHRGLALSTTSAYTAEQGGNVCVQTDVRFLLWYGDADSTTFCECYLRDERGDYTLTQTSQGTCAH